MLTVYDKDLRKLAILENAFGVTEDLQINAINYLNFSIPANDRKNKHLKPFNYIRTERGLYRILPCTLESSEVDVYKYECEHVLATLLDDVIFGHSIVGNLGVYTKEVIEYVLNKQTVKRWRLGDCEFSRQFEYAWENESLATALFSIPKPLSTAYIWEFDTTNYPWTIHLRKLETEEHPKIYIMDMKNKIRLTKTSDPKNIVTRLYPLGYGEGVNQLNIKEVNNNKPYLQSPQEYIDKYGLINRIWIDRRYEDEQSLKDAAQTMLNELQEPLKEYSVGYAMVDRREREHVKLGTKIEVRNETERHEDYIVGVKIYHDEIERSDITIANKPQTIAGTVADMADRQRIEMSYSQGATQLYAQSLQANADTKYGAELNFYIPAEMRIINKVIAKIKVDSFRAYSKATEGGKSNITSTESGGTKVSSTEYEGGDFVTSRYAGGERYTSGMTEIGGRSTQTEDDYTHHGSHNHGIPKGAQISIAGHGSYTWYPSGAHSHGEHNHKFETDSHQHEVKFPRHSHSLDIPKHVHKIDMPNHIHKIEPGIFRFGYPRGFDIRVNGKWKKTVNDTGIEIDITDFLLDNKKKISRGTWHTVSIVPDDIAYISIDLTIQGFVQSRGDYTV